MPRRLPQRPNLDHLRRQAKSLMAAIEAGDQQAIATLKEHLPAAGGMTPAQIRQANFCLADAQSAIARKTGFANWPQLARHIEQLRALEGTWVFQSLEVDGRGMPAAMLAASRILMDGDCFRSEMAGTLYEGVFTIDVEPDPHTIDIEFVSGPEGGNTNRGIFALEGDQLKICLDMSGKHRPTAFRTMPGSHCALEVLRRSSTARPDAVTGGTAVPTAQTLSTLTPADFEGFNTPTIEKLQGDWAAVQIITDGNPLPPPMLAKARRTARGNELKVTVAGQVMIHAKVRINELVEPVQVDYLHLNGPMKGTLQSGIMKWMGNDVCFCMSPPAQPRPTTFDCPAGSGHTLSQWRKEKT